MKMYLGIELGSTRIKAVVIDEKYNIISKGEYGWKSDYVNGIWTYSLDEAWKGLKVALKEATESIDTGAISAVGISGMMHGYLAFDLQWNLLAPFATWQNTITEESAKELTEKFNFNVPQRWSVAHLYQRILNGEKHVERVAHITTLAGYIHYCLTGTNIVGIGEASGMFPIDSRTNTYDEEMCEKFNSLLKAHGIDRDVRDMLPKVKVAGEYAGKLNNTSLLDDMVPHGVPFVPPEGDMQTGMVATNSVAVGTGNISAGTSFNLTVVTGKNLNKVYPEIDIICTPTGTQSALIHSNNGTNDINAWFSVLEESAALFGANTDELYTKLFEHSLTADADCGGVTVYNYMAGEAIAHINEGKPMVTRKPDSAFTLANFVRAQLYASLAPIKLGTEIIADEHIEIKRITGHGGFFKTPKVAQKYTASAFNAPIYCNLTAGEGGPYGMALLASYFRKDVSLEQFLNTVFKDNGTEVKPDKQTADGFDKFMSEYKKGLAMQKV